MKVMTREEWMEERKELGWLFSCLLEDEIELQKRREELAQRVEQLNLQEPMN